MLYAAMTKWGLALRDFHNAIKIAPRSSRYFLERAKVYIHLREWKRASADLESALSLTRNYELLAEIHDTVDYMLQSRKFLS